MTRQEFAAWLEEVLDEGVGRESDIVETRDSVEAFRKACIEIEEREEEDANGTPVTILRKTQRVRGEKRRTLFIADCGEKRLVYSR